MVSRLSCKTSSQRFDVGHSLSSADNGDVQLG
jgi:hypothetical protein